MKKGFCFELKIARTENGSLCLEGHRLKLQTEELRIDTVFDISLVETGQNCEGKHNPFSPYAPHPELVHLSCNLGTEILCFCNVKERQTGSFEMLGMFVKDNFLQFDSMPIRVSLDDFDPNQIAVLMKEYRLFMADLLKLVEQFLEK